MWYLRKCALLLLAQLAILTVGEYKFATLQATAESMLSNETGTTRLGGRALNTVHSYSSPTVVIAESGLLLMELSNFVLAGTEFADKPAVPGLETVKYHVFSIESTADVILRVNGNVERTLTVPALTTSTMGGSWLEQDVEIVSTADVLVIMYQAPTVTLNKPFMPLPPVAKTIYGQCSASCRIQIWGGETTVPIQRTCTDGSTATVTAGAFTGTLGYNGVTCKWTAPDGHRISGAANSDGTGTEPDVAAFLPSEYFQFVTPVPTYMAVLLLISTGPAWCSYGSNSVTLAGASGVYHARLTAVNAATVIECDTPVTAVGDASCVVSSCTGREMNLIVGPSNMTMTLTTTTTTTATTTSSASSTSTTTTSSSTSFTSTTVTSTRKTNTTTASSSSSSSSTMTAPATTASTITTSASTMSATTSATMSATTVASNPTDSKTGTTTSTTSASMSSTTAFASNATENATGSSNPSPSSTATSTRMAPASTVSASTTSATTFASEGTEMTSGSTATASTTPTSATASTSSAPETNTFMGTRTTLSATNTTGTTTTTASTSAAALVDRVEALEASLLAALMEDNSTTIVTERVDGLSVVAARLDAAAVAAAGGSLTVRLEESQAAATVPESLFSRLNLGVDGVVLTVANVDLATEGFTTEGFTGSGSKSDLQVATVVNVNLFSLAGRRLSVSGLVEPIKVTMPVNQSTGLQCVHWDEGISGWATRGVKTGSVDEGILECWSTHLTFFAAIFRGFLNTLTCSQVTLLNAEALKEMGKGDWYRSLGALVFWSLLATFMLLLLVAAWLDCRRRRQGRPNGEHLLIPLQTAGAGAPQEDGSTDGEASAERRGHCGCCAACCAAVGCTWLVDWCRSSGALRDALDEIFSQWAEHFGEIRDLVEGLTEGLELCAHTRGSSAGARVAMVVHQLLSSTLVISARRQAAASLGVSWDVSSLIMENEAMFDVVRAHRTRRGPDRAAHLTRGASTTTLSREEAWGRLHSDVEAELGLVMEASARWSSLPGAVWRLFLHQNPFSVCLVHCALTSCKMRVLLLMVDIVGSVMLATVFFSATGIPKKRNQGVDCDVDDPFEFVGQILAIGTGSLVVAGIPATILGSLCTRSLKKFDYEGCPEWNRQLKAWHIQDRAIWGLGVLYIAFCVFFVSLFLANVDEKDHGGWLMSGGLSIVENTLLIPLIVALILCFMVTACLNIMSHQRRVTKEELVSELHLKFKSRVNMSVSVGRI